MKCTNCGGKDFIKIDVVDGSNMVVDAGQLEQWGHSYVCTRCGHVEWYLDEKEIAYLVEERDKERNEKAERDKKVNKLVKELTELETKINNNKKIISDEDQTVKSVKRAVDENEMLEDKKGELMQDLRMIDPCNIILGPKANKVSGKLR